MVSKDQSRRDRIKIRIAKSQAQLRDSKPSSSLPALPDADPPEKISGLAAEYPGLVIAGGLALGLLAGSLLPRSAGTKLSRRTTALVGIVSEVGLVLGKQALERASTASRDGRGKLGELGDVLGEKAAGARRKAGAASSAMRVTGLALAKKALEIAAKPGR
jgi:hypothetical protein